jgi:hypothetical protein
VRDRQVKAVVDNLQVKVSQVKTKGKRSGDNAANSPVTKKVKRDL